MAGRAVQGIGASGLMPLGMAFISAIFAADQRGKALGTWSQVGPIAGFVGPLLAGVIITAWGWRASFVVPLLVGLAGFLVVYYVIPSGLSNIEPGFLRHFDWPGVALADRHGHWACSSILSSRPITGAGHRSPTGGCWSMTVCFWAPAAVVGAAAGRSVYSLDVFENRVFVQASGAASMRMVIMAGVGFLIPLYLVDVRDMSAAAMGVMLVINPGAMALMVRQGGQIADRWGSRMPVLIGMVAQISVVIMLFFLPATAPIWMLVLILAFHGLGAGTDAGCAAPLGHGRHGAGAHGLRGGTVQHGALRGHGHRHGYGGRHLAALSGQRPCPRWRRTNGAFSYSASRGMLGIVFAASMREPAWQEQKEEIDMSVPVGINVWSRLVDRTFPVSGPGRCAV